MKKMILIGSLILILFLAGCARSEEQAQVDANQNADLQNQPQIINSDPPSFEDGDLYLKAIGQKNVELCDKINHSELRIKCKTKIVQPGN